MERKYCETSKQCVNCGLCVKRKSFRVAQRVAEESEDLRQLLTDWTGKELVDDDSVCSECYSLLRFGIKTGNKSRKFGHKHVCLVCGYSIFRTRTTQLTNRPQLKSVVAQWIPSHLIKQLEMICKKCHARADRWIKQRNKLHSESNALTVKTEIDSACNGVHVKVEPMESLGYGELDIPASSESEDEIQKDEDQTSLSNNSNQENAILQPTYISLPNYKRAADSAHRCIFKHCKSPIRKRLPRVLIERLLIDYSFYVPGHSRICEQHLVNSHQKWSELVKTSEITDFSVAHLENLFSILKNSRHNSYCNNFDSAIKRNKYLCKYWLGVSYETYEEMLKDIQPMKKRVWWLKKSLTMFLMKRHTGFSYEKLAMFFGVRPLLLVKIINRVQGYLESKVDWDHTYVAIPGNQETVYYRI